MVIDEGTMIAEVAKAMQIPEEELVQQGLRTYLERELRLVKAEIFEISGRYTESGAEEMEERYKEGNLEETNSWQDLQRLDHLEFKQDRLYHFLKPGHETFSIKKES